MPGPHLKTNGIPPNEDGIKNVSASYQRNKKFIKKWLQSSDFVYILETAP